MREVYLVRKIVINSSATGEVSAELYEDKNRKTGDAIWNALPIEARANRWGEEIYFSTGAKIGEENSQEVVQVGEIGYWPPGKAFCIFFGRTPASTDDKPRAASPVNVFGKVIGDPSVFRKVRDGDRITIDKAK
jgi:hypothetical protein